MKLFLLTALVGTFWVLIQFLAALPWLAVVDNRTFKSLTRPKNWLWVPVGCAAAGVGLALFLNVVQDPDRLLAWGRLFGGILHLQLGFDFFVAFFPLLILLWPKGGSVALAAFREGIRQPMYWLILGITVMAILFSPFLPYFTFGEDYKMVKVIGFNMIMLAAVLFCVLAASMSITEEIEGRTAITVMSKPVSRRQFLIGKFIGILAAGLLMTGLLGWLFSAVMWYEMWSDQQQVGIPAWVMQARVDWTGKFPGPPMDFSLGTAVWFTNTADLAAGLILGFCQAVVLLAIAVALATRLPFIVSFVTCVVFFFLGHLTYVLVKVSGDIALVNFMARFFDSVLPGLGYFDLGTIIVRDVQPDTGPFSIYVGSVVLYAILYSVIALLFGLILFEDRDLA